MFVLLPIQEFFTHLKTSPLPMKGCAILDLYSALMTIMISGFFNVQRLLWQGPTVYNGHLRGPVTLTPVAELWQWSYHYLFEGLLFIPNVNRIGIFRVQSISHGCGVYECKLSVGVPTNLLFLSAKKGRGWFRLCKI